MVFVGNIHLILDEVVIIMTIQETKVSHIEINFSAI